jgi:chloramphenicol-sensitive protein RarD
LGLLSTLPIEVPGVKRGIYYGAGAYLLWGFFPLYFKALQAVPALEIMFHRVVWSFLFLAGLILARREWPRLKSEVARPKILLIYAVAGVLLALNWLVYIYGVNAGQVVETSLGYFINPLVSVALGVIFLRERLRPAQWVPIGLAATGVLYLTLQYGTLPWIALSLATTFGLYGLVKKVAPLGALYGLSLETAILFLPALGYLLFAESQGSGSFGHLGWNGNLLLALSGVITALPLLMFATAARLIPLYMVGILQYIAPTCQFLLGVLVFHEPFTPARVVGFSIIWAALAIYWLEGLVERRRAALAATAA